MVDAVLGASRALVAVAARSLATVADDVTLAQYRALIELAARGPQRLADLATALTVERSTATRMCDRLVRKRLVTRERGTEDRRVVRVSLTDAGAQLVAEVSRRRRSEIRRIVRRIPVAGRPQVVGMPAHRLRIIVACGAAGGIAATFNAPVTGLFFGFEIILREFSLDALCMTSLAAVTGDVISRALFGSAPFFTAVPHDLLVRNDASYLLVAVLAIAAGLIGVGFKTVLYGMEDRVGVLWRGRPEWARPVVGGVALGLLLLALPQMYGVGYPVMDSVIAGHVVLGLVLLFLVGKIAATSLTLSIGGSGGVFAPSLFIGTMTGMAFGTVARHVFGPSIGPPALYAVVAMGGVFAAAAQAPLTAIASVVEMTGNFTLTLPIMLAAGIAAAVSKQISYGSVYTTKLLRRGIDIERPARRGIAHALPVADPVPPPDQA